MLINEAWLKEFVNYSLTTEQLTDKLTMAGLEVDSVAPAAAEFKSVVVGEVLSAEQHPNADKLSICKVDIGDSDALNIVCGASNVRAGLRVAVATVGAVLPDNFKIKKSKLRGESSNGMLCSEQELGLADSADGILELPSDAPIGTCIREYMQLDDTIIEVDLTPNRADCLSIEGVAREVACFSDEKIQALKTSPIDESIKTQKTVQVDAPEDCPRYLGRVIEGLNASATTPLWMQEKLRRCGQRSLGPLVDVTNYVLLELGQPLHAFDLAKLQGDIVVRRASKGEKLVLLNEQEIDLDDGALVIADEAAPLALAGVMGGEPSSVGDKTTDVFLECAFFAPLSIAGKARKFGLHTDSSHRFERGVDPQLCYRALDRATELLLEIAGGNAGPVTDVSNEKSLPNNPSIKLRLLHVNSLLGIEFTAATVEGYLAKLDMQCVNGKNADEWMVTAPSYRFDIEIEADLVEEVARLYGYDKLPHVSLNIPSTIVSDVESRQPIDRVKDLLVDLGYQEAVTYSFTDEALLQKLTPNAEFYRLQNPISSDMSVMRTTLWAGLLMAVESNLKQKQESIRLFETGLKFTVKDGELRQEQMLSLAVTGDVWPEQWSEKTRKVDFYDVKHDIEAILNLNGKGATGRAAAFEFKTAAHEALHPGQTAELITANGKLVGTVGLLHPALEKSLDINKPVYLVELKQDLIIDKSLPIFEPITKYPWVRRDLALNVDKNLSVNSIISYISNLECIIKGVILFDVYEGEGVETGRKSIALGLILQDKSKTLVDQGIEMAIEKLLVSIKDLFDAQLRE
ncbi:MAG: phenylalanine--tRNA ligase subunit beta [Cycloclasticus sp. symbiont of Poecilosclerida sp. M]|nr:MAG: phenylalanine--tRNA ligase subunit beta [Cycloclasticus sp. symbiont of Poecilosclerida sp. M]